MQYNRTVCFHNPRSAYPERIANLISHNQKPGKKDMMKKPSLMSHISKVTTNQLLKDGMSNAKQSTQFTISSQKLSPMSNRIRRQGDSFDVSKNPASTVISGMDEHALLIETGDSRLSKDVDSLPRPLRLVPRIGTQGRHPNQQRTTKHQDLKMPEIDFSKGVASITDQQNTYITSPPTKQGPAASNDFSSFIGKRTTASLFQVNRTSPDCQNRSSSKQYIATMMQAKPQILSRPELTSNPLLHIRVKQSAQAKASSILNRKKASVSNVAPFIPGLKESEDHGTLSPPLDKQRKPYKQTPSQFRSINIKSPVSSIKLSGPLSPLEQRTSKLNIVRRFNHTATELSKEVKEATGPEGSRTTFNNPGDTTLTQNVFQSPPGSRLKQPLSYTTRIKHSQAPVQASDTPNFSHRHDLNYIPTSAEEDARDTSTVFQFTNTLKQEAAAAWLTPQATPGNQENKLLTLEDPPRYRQGMEMNLQGGTQSRNSAENSCSPSHSMTPKIVVVNCQDDTTAEVQSQITSRAVERQKAQFRVQYFNKLSSSVARSPRSPRRKESTASPRSHDESDSHLLTLNPVVQPAAPAPLNFQSMPTRSPAKKSPQDKFTFSPFVERTDPDKFLLEMTSHSTKNNSRRTSVRHQKQSDSPEQRERGDFILGLFKAYESLEQERGLHGSLIKFIRFLNIFRNRHGSVYKETERKFFITEGTLAKVEDYQNSILDRKFRSKHQLAESLRFRDEPACIDSDKQDDDSDPEEFKSSTIRKKVRVRGASGRKASKRFSSKILSQLSISPGFNKKETRNSKFITFQQRDSPVRHVQGFQREQEFQWEIQRKLSEIANVRVVDVVEKKDLVNEFKSATRSEESQSSSSSQRSSESERKSAMKQKAKERNVVQRDRELRKTFSNVGGATVELLTGLLKDSYQKEEKEKVVTLLKHDLQKMIESNINQLTNQQVRTQVQKKLQRQKTRGQFASKSKIEDEYLSVAKKQQVKAAIIRRQSISFQQAVPMSLKKLVGDDFIEVACSPPIASIKSIDSRPSLNLGSSSALKNLKKTVSKIIFSKKRINMGFAFKIVTMTQALEEIMPEKMTLGEKYDLAGTNIWKNNTTMKAQMLFKKKNIEFRADYDTNTSKLSSVDIQFRDNVCKSEFYSKAKQFKVGNESDPLAVAQLDYLQNCQKMNILPLPTFAKLVDGTLYLAETRMSESLALALNQYLKSTTGESSLMVRQLFIDDCGMKDEQFALILEGIKAQGRSLNVLSYGNNEIGPHSLRLLKELIPDLRELILVNNRAKSESKQSYEELLMNVIDSNFQIQKLKLSNINLNDSNLVDLICEIVKSKELLTTLCLSWTKLGPQHLEQIAFTIRENFQKLKNLDLSYNSLMFSGNERQMSQNFVSHISEFVELSQSILHINFSGMSLNLESILKLSQAVVTSSTMMALHLSDNSIRQNSEWFEELVEIFSLKEQMASSPPKYLINQPVENSSALLDIVRKSTGMISKQDVQKSKFHMSQYKKFILQTKQTKSIQMHKAINQMQMSSGIGRNGSSQLDEFIVTRVVNGSELVFNQHPHIDAYFQEDSAHRWVLSDSSECYYCQRHRFTMIFFEQKELSKRSKDQNEDLIEITDPDVVEQIEENLSFGFLDEGETAPIIVGTVVNDKRRAFRRKLRMIRTDIFSMLSVCQSRSIVQKKNQSKHIKQGIHQLLVANKQKVHEDFPYFSNFGQVIYEKTKKNQAQDVCSINFPKGINVQKFDEFGRPIQTADCTSYIYAAYLPPGHHQFIIYCPLTKKAYCKDMIVDLNQFDLYPEYPLTLDDVKKVQKIRQNVWKSWREDSEADIQFAFTEDIKESFNPENFLKDPEDVEECKKIMLENFRILQVAYVEGLADSPQTFPEIAFLTFLNMILAQQKTDKEKKRLERSKIELSFISATRGDDAKGLSGTLCRGEFMEVILRLCNQIYPRQAMAPYLQEFLTTYFRGIYEKSKLLLDRKAIRASRTLNNLLFDNTKGLKMLYSESKVKGKFMFDSAMKLFSPLSKTPKSPMEPCFQNMRFHFVFSKMTNLLDLQECGRYFQLLFVEFLELISRFAIAYWEDQEKEGVTPPESVGEQVQFILEKLWEPKIKVQNQKNLLLNSIANKFSKQIGIKRSSKITVGQPADEFPALIRIDQEQDEA